MTPPENRIKGGLFALNLDEAKLLVGWGQDQFIAWAEDFTEKEGALLDRLREWTSRHEEAP